MKKFPDPNPPYVQARHVNAKQRPTAIMLSLSWTTSDEKAALALATRFHKTTSPVESYHYMLDEAETYRGVWNNLGAANAPLGAISILMCGQPQESLSGWNDPGLTRVFERTAELVANVALANNVRPLYLDEEAEEKWKRHKWRHRGGIISKVPGFWPQRDFLDLVNFMIKRKAT